MARTVGARRKVLGATVDVSAMGTVAPKECEGDVGVALGCRSGISIRIDVSLDNKY